MSLADLEPILSSAFKRDMRRLANQGKDLEKLNALVQTICRRQALPREARPHPLKGQWKGYWECHVEPDWVMVWRIVGQELRLARTGDHDEVLDK